MNVLFRFDAGEELARRVGALKGEGLDVRLCSERDDEDYRRDLASADVLWHVLKPVSAQDIAGAAELRLIQKIGVGVNTIDLEAAAARGIAVCNMPGTNSRAVAEHTLSLMLAASRRLTAFDRATRQGSGWNWPDGWQDDLGEIGGLTVGLVGFGSVPRLLAPMLHAMGAEVVYCSRSEAGDVPWRRVAKAELLARSDIVSLHVPLVPETRNWLDAASIAAMKPGAILVNVARGGLVDEAALVAALDDRRLRGAGLDVFAREPVAPDDPLLSRDDVVVTPHVAWLTRQTFERSIAVAVENCRRLARGRDLLNRVA